MHLQRKNTSFFGVRHKKHDVVQGTQGKMPQRTQKRGLTFIKFQFHLKTQFRCQKYSDLRIPFSVVRFPHTESNIPQNIFYSGIKGEFLRTAPSALCLRAFIPKAK